METGGAVRVDESARGRAQADAQGRCDGAGSEQSARFSGRRDSSGGFFRCPDCLVKLRSGGLGQVNAKDRRAGFCPAFRLNSQLVALEIARASVKRGRGAQRETSHPFALPTCVRRFVPDGSLLGLMSAFAAGWQSVTGRY